jgi:hypothetical protein
MPPKDPQPRKTRQGSRRALLGMALATGLALGTAAPAAAGSAERTDVYEQDGVTVLAEDGARLIRQPNGLHVSLRMPAPDPGTYVYPAGTTPGSPEVFTLWMFVFNKPWNCTGPCGPDDATNEAVEFGVYNPAGHVNAGGWLTLSGRVGVGDEAQGPPGVVPYPLVNPDGAEVHLAVTSHGELDPATLPNEFRIPTGSPVCGCWWVAEF